MDDQERGFIPLASYFKFIHEPIIYNSYESQSFNYFIGRQKDIEDLSNRIIFSNGGSFLVTGYRGVGKTSFVNQVIKLAENNLNTNSEFDYEMIPIHINISRKITSIEIMYHIIRGIYYEFEQRDLIDKLSNDIKDGIMVAFKRTLMTISKSNEIGREIKFDLSTMSSGFGLLDLIMKPFSGSYSRLSKNDFSYLGYDDKSAEYDIIRLCRKISNFSTRKYRFIGRKRKFKLVFIFDELDKISEIDNSIEEIFNNLKNLFTTSNTFFVFIAGRDFQQKVNEEIMNGDSIYESIFTYRKYLPIMWNDSHRISDGFVDREFFDINSNIHNKRNFDNYTYFRQFMRYKSRGIPRKVFILINQFVMRNNQGVGLYFSLKDIRKIKFFAILDGILKEELGNEKMYFDGLYYENYDDKMLLLYNIVDFILSSYGKYFNKIDIEDFIKKTIIYKYNNHFVDIINKSIDILMKYEYIEYAIKEEIDNIAFDMNNLDNKKIEYVITKRRIIEVMDEYKIIDYVNKDSLDDKDNLGFYEKKELIAHGGMSEIYTAIDTRTKKRVAIKMIKNNINDIYYRTIFEQESDILISINHNNIVKAYAKGIDNDRQYFVMQYIEGITLNRVIDIFDDGLDINIALSIINPIIDAHIYLHEQGLYRTDIKPSNIMIDKDGHVWMIDLGIIVDRTNRDIAIVPAGTIQYSPPESFTDSFDERVDIFSIGIILSCLVQGYKNTVDRKYTKGDILKIISGIPLKLRESISMMIEIDVNERIQTMKQVKEMIMDEEIENINLIDLFNAVNKSMERKSDIENIITNDFFGYEEKEFDNDDTVTYISEDSIIFVGDKVRDRNDVLIVIKNHNTMSYNYNDSIVITDKLLITIGRSYDNDIIINNEKISRYHARIYYLDGKWFIEELNTINGVKVNGNMIDMKKILVDKDEIMILNAKFRFLKPESTNILVSV